MKQWPAELENKIKTKKSIQGSKSSPRNFKSPSLKDSYTLEWHEMSNTLSASLWFLFGK